MTTFAREWNAALGVIARWTAMRRQNRGFYGQDKSAR